MISLQPDLSVRPIEQKDAAALSALLNPKLALAPFSHSMNAEAVLAEVLRSHPRTVFPARFRINRCLGTWRAGQLVGAIDVAVGFDSESVELPDYQPLGLLRFLALPERPDLVADVAQTLLDAAEVFWRGEGAVQVKAFHASTGYPSFQAGVGLLPGDWDDSVRVLTAHGYTFSDRYYCLRRPITGPVEEFSPAADAGLVFDEQKGDRRCTIYRRRTERIGASRLVGAMTDQVGTHREGVQQTLGVIAALHVDPHWRQRNFGRWLVSRMINDGFLLRYSELVAFLSTDQGAAMNLLTQLGFEEMHYRGYVLEKALS